MTRRSCARLTGCVAILLASTISVHGRLPPPQGESARATIDRYCVGCHNDTARIGGLSLNGLDVARAGEHAEVWEKVIRKLRTRMMPPPGRPRPDENGYDATIADLATVLDRAAAAN